MKHFGIFITDLESERFMAASNDQVATWLFLHAFCSKQMNGGTVACAATLPERFWSRHGITHSILMSDSPLWSWIDGSLSVSPYDIKGEELYAKKSQGGKDGANRRWKGSENGSPNGSPNRPDHTRPDHTIPKKRSASAFQKPTLEMVTAYGITLEPPFTASSDFMDYYDGNGWKIAKASMKDWKATVRRWNRNQKAATQTKPKEFSANDCSI
jgi:hypothetical protein